jgi:LacI family transcriptional regulator, galactose operon repressor
VGQTVTIKDVALRAGVSSATVSLVLNNVAEARVSAATAERVRAAAAELAYAPNLLARGLRRQRTNTIAVLSDEIATTPFASQMIGAIQDVAMRTGLLVFMVNTDGDPETERSAVAAFNQQQVDGFVYACLYHRVVDLPPGMGTNVVVLDGRTRRPRFPAVVPDDRGGARAAVTELLAHGHRRIGFINDYYATVAADLRLKGYRDALREFGLRVDRRCVVYAEPGLESSADAAVRLHEDAGVTALFCFNDRVAVGAYRGLARRGLAVPRDVSVVGFDDQEFVADYADPPLTTVALPHYAMGHWAAQALVARINGRDGPAEVRVMPCQLVRRGSVGPAAVR